MSRQKLIEMTNLEGDTDMEIYGVSTHSATRYLIFRGKGSVAFFLGTKADADGTDYIVVTGWKCSGRYRKEGTSAIKVRPLTKSEQKKVSARLRRDGHKEPINFW